MTDGISAKSNPADSDDRQVDIIRPHLTDNFFISFQTQNRAEFLLGGGISERSAADVIYSVEPMLLYVFIRVGCTAYDIFLSKYASRFGNGHVVLAEMYAIRPDFLYQFHVVVDDEYGTIIVAEFCALPRLRAVFRFPAASFMRSCIQRQPPSKAMRAES